MEALDLAAEDVFVTAAAKGRSAKLLRPSDKRTVGRWCVLVATLFDQGQAQPRLDATFHQAFYRGAIPEGVAVWRASVVPDDTAPGRVRIRQGLDLGGRGRSRPAPARVLRDVRGRTSRRTGDDPVLFGTDEYPHTPSHVRQDPPVWRHPPGDMAGPCYSSHMAPAGATGLGGHGRVHPVVPDVRASLLTAPTSGSRGLSRCGLCPQPAGVVIRAIRTERSPAVPSCRPHPRRDGRATCSPNRSASRDCRVAHPVTELTMQPS